MPFYRIIKQFGELSKRNRAQYINYFKSNKFDNMVKT